MEVDKLNNDNPVLDIFLEGFLPKLLKTFDDHTREDESLIMSRQLIFDILISSIKILKYFDSFPKIILFKI